MISNYAGAILIERIGDRKRLPNVNMKVVAAQFPPEMIEAMDELVKAKYYPNRNELIRIAVRDLLIAHKEVRAH